MEGLVRGGQGQRHFTPTLPSPSGQGEASCTPIGRSRGDKSKVIFAIAIIACLGGCGARPNDQKEKDKKKVDKPVLENQSVLTSAGNALIKSPPPTSFPEWVVPAGVTNFLNSVDPDSQKRIPQWYIAWKKAAVDLGMEGLSTGKMEGASGHLFDKGVPASTFEADEAMGDTAASGFPKVQRSLRELTLQGNVHLVSPDANEKTGPPQAELFCDRVVFDAPKNLIRAQGHVRISGKVGTIGTLAEIWASPDLKRIATPDMYYDK